MRWVLALVLVCSVAACRRSAPPPEPAEPEPVAASPAAPADVPAPAPADVAPASAERGRDPVRPQAATAPPTAQEPTPTETLPVADVPAPPARGATDDRDDRIYSWTDKDGSVHYGSADEVPAAHRKGARVVDTGVTVVSPEPVGDLPSTPTAAPPPPAEAEGQPARPRHRGAQPELDAAGLPIPGTMDDTAATRAAKTAGETQIDPAAVERRRQEDLRRMNCKEKDGVWICG